MLEQMLGLLFSQSPSAIQWLAAVGQEYENRGFLRGAEWLYRQVVRLGGPSSKAYYQLGRVLSRRGMLPDAKQSFARSLELKPDFYLCRLGFFELCRQEYWRPDEAFREKLTWQVNRSDEAAANPGDLKASPQAPELAPSTPSAGGGADGSPELLLPDDANDGTDPALDFFIDEVGLEARPSANNARESIRRTDPSARRQKEVPHLPRETRLRLLHLLLSEALSPLMRAELARVDETDVETSIYERLVNSQHVMQLSKKAARQQAAQLELAGTRLEQARKVLLSLKPQHDRCRRRVCQLTLRKKPPVQLVGLRDSDDLVGYHLEYISGGQLKFLAFEALRSVSFGLTSEFTESTLVLKDGTELRAVVPSLYYGSLDSGHAELARGEFSVFKELYPDLRMGIGRRVFVASPTGVARDVMAIAFQEIASIHFLD